MLINQVRMATTGHNRHDGEVKAHVMAQKSAHLGFMYCQNLLLQNKPLLLPDPTGKTIFFHVDGAGAYNLRAEHDAVGAATWRTSDTGIAVFVGRNRRRRRAISSRVAVI